MTVLCLSQWVRFPPLPLASEFSYVYSDSSVVCGNTEYHHIKNDGIINPVLVVEVLSPNTMKYDRGAKFRKYCSIPSFKEYVLITQDEPVVEVLFRDIDFWRMTTIVGLEKSVKLNSLDIETNITLEPSADIAQSTFVLPENMSNPSLAQAYHQRWDA